ncbi:MAG: CoA pyrophosphatase [Acidobacteriota bacterium]
MTLAQIAARLAEAQGHAVPEAGGARPAAVLVPIYERDGDVHLLYTKRTEDVPHHKGQISFPGGIRRDASEELHATALRETHEEIGLPADRVRVVGALPPLVTITDFLVFPFVGIIPYPFSFEPEPREIAEILHVALRHLQDPAHMRTSNVTYRGRPEVLHFYDVPPHVIWGVTGRITASFLERVGESTRRQDPTPPAGGGEP